MNYERIIITGQSGIRCIKNNPETPEDIKNFFIHDIPGLYEFVKFEDVIKENYANNNENKNLETIWLNDFLQDNIPKIENEWAEAAKKITSKLYDGSNIKKYIISMHAVFYNHRTIEYISPVRETLLKSLQPQLFITFIDDIFDVHQRLRYDGHIFNPIHGGATKASDAIFELIRILDWRAREIMMTRHLANELGAEHKILAIKHSRDTLRKLIVGNGTTCYLSHPITPIRELQKLNKMGLARKMIREIVQFEHTLSDKVIAFLPTTIDEYRICQKGDKLSPDLLERWNFKEYEKESFKIFKPLSPPVKKDPLWGTKANAVTSILLKILHKMIENQVTSRDHNMVEQSKMLMVYRPFFMGKVSSGVLAEIDYYVSLQKLQGRCVVYIHPDDVKMLIVDQFQLETRQYLVGNKLKGRKTLGTKFALNEGEKKKLLDNFNDIEKLKIIIKEVFNKNNITLALKGGALSGDDTFKSTEFFKKFAEELKNKIDSIIARYRDSATIYIDHQMSDVDIVEKLLEEDHKNEQPTDLVYESHKRRD